MENIMLQTMQRKKILFLISLPSTSEFQECVSDVNECLDELRQLHVDVREHIRREDIAEANNYDVVIVVAHRDISSDELVLADGTMLIKDFVSSIPSDFKGVIDFSSCYSATAFNAIKDRCPQCKVQVAVVETTLLRRLIIYPSIVECLYDNPTIDYAAAYKEVSKAFDYAMDEIDSKDSDIVPMTHLGEQMTSIYAPKEVKRDSVFQIIVFFHYDFEKGVIKVKAERWQTNAIIRDDFEIPILLNENDEISVSLSFDSTDNNNIRVKDNEYSKTIAIKKELLVEKFIVIVMPDFRGNSFLANIEMTKEDEPFIRCAFNIDVVDSLNEAPAEVVAEVPVIPETPEDIIKCYADVFTGRIFDYDSNAGYYSNFQQILSKKNADSDKLHFIRRFIYNNDFFLIQLKKFVDSNNNELSNLLKEDSKDKTVITWDIVPLLKSCIIKIQERLDSFEAKFRSVKIKARGTLNFDEALPKIPSLESKFIDLSSNIKYIDYQIQMLKIYKELRDNLNKYSKEDIKESASDFWEYPHKHLVDQGLFNILRAKCDVGAIKHPKSGGDKGVTMPYLALLLAMVCGEYTSIDNGKEDWYINIANYIDLSNYNKSLRTPKNRINKFISVLKSQDVRDSISQYMKTKVGKMSVSAVLLLKMKV